MSDHASSEYISERRPFTEQIAYFRQKLGNLVPTQVWDDMLAAEHDRGFMVAGATKADLLADLAAAVDKAISEGKGLEEFRKDFKAIVARHGWTGWTGEGSQRGEAWRVRTILRTNAMTSYAAGRYAQLKAANFKYWIYRHGGSKHPRPQHLDWDGLILPADHEFWDIFYPPSDWGCSCYVIGAGSMVAAKIKGGDPNKKLAADWKAPDPKTGLPRGVGKGWNYAPGQSVEETVNALAAKIRHWDYGVARAFMAGLPEKNRDAISSAYRNLPSTGDDMRRMAQRIFAQKGARSPKKQVESLGMVPSVQVAEIEQKIGRKLDKPDFKLTSDFVHHVQDHHANVTLELSRGQKPIAPLDFAYIARILGRPDSIVGPMKNRELETLLEYKRVLGGRQYTLIVQVQRGRLTLKTFYAGK